METVPITTSTPTATHCTYRMTMVQWWFKYQWHQYRSLCKAYKNELKLKQTFMSSCHWHQRVQVHTLLDTYRQQCFATHYITRGKWMLWNTRGGDIKAFISNHSKITTRTRRLQLFSTALNEVLTHKRRFHTSTMTMRPQRLDHGDFCKV